MSGHTAGIFESLDTEIIVSMTCSAACSVSVRKDVPCGKENLATVLNTAAAMSRCDQRDILARHLTATARLLQAQDRMPLQLHAHDKRAAQLSFFKTMIGTGQS